VSATPEGKVHEAARFIEIELAAAFSPMDRSVASAGHTLDLLTIRLILYSQSVCLGRKCQRCPARWKHDPFALDRIAQDEYLPVLRLNKPPRSCPAV
jgi:hypothetical protein